MLHFKFEFSLVVAEGSETIRHASLSLGKPVIGTGRLKINDGELTYIDVESGHYQPSPSTLFNTVQTLKKIGVKLSPEIVQVKYYTDDGDVIETSLADFLEQSKNIGKSEKHNTPLKQISSFPL